MFCSLFSFQYLISSRLRLAAFMSDRMQANGCSVSIIYSTCSGRVLLPYTVSSVARLFAPCVSAVSCQCWHYDFTTQPDQHPKHGSPYSYITSVSHNSHEVENDTVFVDFMDYSNSRISHSNLPY
jgi:hypothetical protein